MSRRLGLPIIAVLLVAVLATLVAACGGAGTTAPSGSPERLKVVATTTVFADLVAHVGGDRVEVSSLVPKGGEVHTFDPTPSDIRRVVEADLIVRNGLGLDDWLANLVADAGSKAPVSVLGTDLPGVEYIGGDAAKGQAVNPHLWLDVAYARKYVDRIAEALSEVDPQGATGYHDRAASYGRELDALDAEIRDRLATIPEADRLVVSFHDAFPYFARAYGLTVDGTIVESPGQDPSAGQIADLVKAIGSKGVRAILTEVQFNPDLAEAIASETDAVVVTDLYTDTLGDPPLDSYVSVIRSDVDRLVEALARS